MSIHVRTCILTSLRPRPQPPRIASLARPSGPSRAAPRRSARAMSSPVPAAAAETREGLKKGIAEFYDESSGTWESVWGDHMHHGFYEPSDAPADVSDHASAQIRMVEESLAFAGLSGINVGNRFFAS